MILDSHEERLQEKWNRETAASLQWGNFLIPFFGSLFVGWVHWVVDMKDVIKDNDHAPEIEKDLEGRDA